MSETVEMNDSNNVESQSVTVPTSSENNVQDHGTNPPSPKQRKLRSAVWNNMTKIKKEDGNYIATCNHCKKEMSANSTQGTTHLRNHLKYCVTYQRSLRKKADIGQLIINASEKKKDGSSNIECFAFDQERSRQDFVRMVILHEYPFAMVDHIGFKIFLRNLQPKFKLLSRSTIQVDALKLYESEKKKRYDQLKKLSCRLSLTTDMWTAIGNVGYLSLTCHYIDDKWKLCKKILNFEYVKSPHDASELHRVIKDRIYEWHIDGKLFSLVLDNASTNDAIVNELLRNSHLRSNLVANGSLFHLRCSAHILNLIVQNGLRVKEVSEIVDRIRNSVRYIRKSQGRKENFQKCAAQLGAPNKALVLDCPTRWNSTFEMLKTAIEFKDVFSRMSGLDKAYNAPALSDWSNAVEMIGCLHLFNEATLRLSGTRYPTCNLCFVDICSLFMSLKVFCKSDNPIIVSMTLNMVAKFEKYWGKPNQLLAIGCILDPRFKMKTVEFFVHEMYPAGYEEDMHIQNIRRSFINLYNEYALQYNVITSSSSSHGSSSHSSNDVSATRNIVPSNMPSLSLVRKGLGQFLQETSMVQPKKSDLDIYLEEPVERAEVEKEEDDKFDILSWWKVNAGRYPILSLMARDVLAIPVSTVASESAFSTGGRVIDQYRSRLDSKTVQALLCAQDWLRTDMEDSQAMESKDCLSTLFSSINLSDLQKFEEINGQDEVDTSESSPPLD